MNNIFVLVPNTYTLTKTQKHTHVRKSSYPEHITCLFTPRHESTTTVTSLSLSLTIAVGKSGSCKDTKTRLNKKPAHTDIFILG